MQAASLRQAGMIQKQLEKLNAGAPEWGSVEHLETIPFGGAARASSASASRTGSSCSPARIARRRSSRTTPGFKVGSRHEREGKTGLAHLFEHLMFNEIEGRAPGEFDRKLEEAGAESNASTWLDWTHYNIAVPEGAARPRDRSSRPSACRGSCCASRR